MQTSISFLQYVFFFLFLICHPLSIHGEEIANSHFKKSIPSADGTLLILNGVAIRKKFFFDIYTIGLYLPEKENDPGRILEKDASRYIVMHFLYDKVEKEKLVAGWNEGFRKNTPEKEVHKLKKQIEGFNAVFDGVHAGDRLSFAYETKTGTAVYKNENLLVIIPGKDFNDALLKIWLGDAPVGGTLKKELLGRN